VRVELCRYELAPLGDRDGWRRTRLGPWLPPLERDTPGLRQFLERHGWLEPP